MKQLKVYKFKIYSTDEQKIFFSKTNSADPLL